MSLQFTTGIVPFIFFCFSVAQSCLTLCDPMDHSTPGFLVLHCLLALAQTHIRWVGDAVQPSHPLSSPSPALNLSWQQCLFQCTIYGLGQMCNYCSIIHNSCPPCSSAPIPSPWQASMFLLSAWFCIFQRVTELNHAVCSLITSILSRVSVCVV